MSYTLSWQQQRDGQIQSAEQVFDDLDEAKKFGEGLGDAAAGVIHDNKTGDQVWPQLDDKEIARQREQRSMKNIKTPAGTVEGNRTSDTRANRPEDLRQMAGADVESASSPSGNPSRTTSSSGQPAPSGRNANPASSNRNAGSPSSGRVGNPANAAEDDPDAC